MAYGQLKLAKMVWMTMDQLSDGMAKGTTSQPLFCAKLTFRAKIRSTRLSNILI